MALVDKSFVSRSSVTNGIGVLAQQQLTRLQYNSGTSSVKEKIITTAINSQIGRQVISGAVGLLGSGITAAADAIGGFARDIFSSNSNTGPTDIRLPASDALEINKSSGQLTKAGSFLTNPLTTSVSTVSGSAAGGGTASAANMGDITLDAVSGRLGIQKPTNDSNLSAMFQLTQTSVAKTLIAGNWSKGAILSAGANDVGSVISTAVASSGSSSGGEIIWDRPSSANTAAGRALTPQEVAIREYHDYINGVETKMPGAASSGYDFSRYYNSTLPRTGSCNASLIPGYGSNMDPWALRNLQSAWDYYGQNGPDCGSPYAYGQEQNTFNAVLGLAVEVGAVYYADKLGKSSWADDSTKKVAQALLPAVLNNPAMTQTLVEVIGPQSVINARGTILNASRNSYMTVSESTTLVTTAGLLGQSAGNLYGTGFAPEGEIIWDRPTMARSNNLFTSEIVIASDAPMLVTGSPMSVDLNGDLSISPYAVYREDAVDPKLSGDSIW